MSESCGNFMVDMADAAARDYERLQRENDRDDGIDPDEQHDSMPECGKFAGVYKHLPIVMHLSSLCQEQPANLSTIDAEAQNE